MDDTRRLTPNRGRPPPQHRPSGPLGGGLLGIQNIPPVPTTRPSQKGIDAFSRLTAGELGPSYPNTKGTQTDFGHAGLSVSATCAECGGGGATFVCLPCMHAVQKQIIEMAAAHEQLITMHRQMQTLTEKITRKGGHVPQATQRMIDAVAPPTTSVPAWLYSIGLGPLATVFADHEVDMDVLKDLTERDLIAMGVADDGKRVRLLLGIARLRNPL